MRKKDLMFIFLVCITTIAHSQNRWAMGFSLSGDKLITNFRGPSTTEAYNLYYGSSIYYNVQFDISKNWFVRSGLGYYGYYFEHQLFTPTYWGNKVEQQNSTYGFLDLPILLGFQSNFKDSPFQVYSSMGVSLSYLFYLKTQYLNPNSFNSSYRDYTVEYFPTGFWGRESFSITGQLATGVFYSDLSKNKYFLGLIFRQQALNAWSLFGSLGIQSGVIIPLPD